MNDIDMNYATNIMQRPFSEKKACVAKFNLTDDTFFRKVVEDTGACEEMLQIILDMPNLRIVENEPQYQLHNIDDRSVILDLLCRDGDGTAFFVEMQKENTHDDYEKRVRYYVSNVDTRNAEKGCSFKDLPDVYSVFISAFDIFNKGKTVYYIDRTLRNYAEKRNNGVHEIYVNATGNEPSQVTELMKYFLDSNGFNPSFPRISDRVQFFKQEKDGILSMSNIMEEYAAARGAAFKAEGIAEGIAAGKAEAKEAIAKALDMTPEQLEQLCKEKNVPIA